MKQTMRLHQQQDRHHSKFPNHHDATAYGSTGAPLNGATSTAPCSAVFQGGGAGGGGGAVRRSGHCMSTTTLGAPDGNMLMEERKRENACDIVDADTYLGEINEINLDESMRLAMRSLARLMNAQDRASLRRKPKRHELDEPRLHTLLERVSMLNGSPSTHP